MKHFHPYQLDESISNSRVSGWHFSFCSNFNGMFLKIDLAPHFMVTDLWLKCLHIPIKRRLNLYELYVSVKINS